MTTTIQSAATTLRQPGVEFEFDEAQLAAVSFLARYSGRTLEAYRHDLRGYFHRFAPIDGRIRSNPAQ